MKNVRTFGNEEGERGLQIMIIIIIDNMPCNILLVLQSFVHTKSRKRLSNVECLNVVAKDAINESLYRLASSSFSKFGRSSST